MGILGSSLSKLLISCIAITIFLKVIPSLANLRKNRNEEYHYIVSDYDPADVMNYKRHILYEKLKSLPPVLQRMLGDYAKDPNLYTSLMTVLTQPTISINGLDSDAKECAEMWWTY